MKVCLRRKDAPCRSQWSVGVKKCCQLEVNLATLLVGDTTNLKHWFLSFSLRSNVVEVFQHVKVFRTLMLRFFRFHATLRYVATIFLLYTQNNHLDAREFIFSQRLTTEWNSSLANAVCTTSTKEFTRAIQPMFEEIRELYVSQ